VDVHRREAQLEIAARDRRRWEAEFRRNETGIKELAKEIDDQKAGLGDQSVELRRLNRKFQRLRRSGRGLKATMRPTLKLNPTKQATSAFAVTERAISALGDVIESLEVEPGSSLRLVAGEEDNLVLATDTQAEGDTGMSHRGGPGLLIGNPIPPILLGRTLDISLSYEGTQIVLTD